MYYSLTDNECLSIGSLVRDSRPHLICDFPTAIDPPESLPGPLCIQVLVSYYSRY